MLSQEKLENLYKAQLIIAKTFSGEAKNSLLSSQNAMSNLVRAAFSIGKVFELYILLDQLGEVSDEILALHKEANKLYTSVSSIACSLDDLSDC